MKSIPDIALKIGLYVTLTWGAVMGVFFAYDLTIRAIDLHIEYMQIRQELKDHDEGKCHYEGIGRCIYDQVNQ